MLEWVCMKNDSIETPELVKEHLKKLGKKGGETTKAKYGPDHYREIGRKGLANRYKKDGR